jgi:hypothetical protein
LNLTRRGFVKIRFDVFSPEGTSEVLNCELSPLCKIEWICQLEAAQ